MNKNQKQRTAWTVSAPIAPQKRPNSNEVLKNSERKFKEASHKHQAAVEKYTKEYESSSEEDELESRDIIEDVLKYYCSSEKNTGELGRTKGVKRNDSIWNCSECYSSFHLQCIQRWSKDTIFQRKQILEGQIQVRQVKLVWCCPKCRYEYLPDSVPTEYKCFCNKTVSPPFQSLIIPHSCGEKCGKPLKPLCGHECVLLCHPGPCPPCPKTVNVKCYCGSKPHRLQRCCSREWSCGSTCNKVLSCGKHKCAQLCHPGDCKPCSKKIIQKCLCGSSQKLRDCTTPTWKCDKVCRKPLECGHHNCPVVCHSGDCGDCEFSKVRTCPCGKTTYQLPCTEETPTCEDTCGKLLECGQHFCNYKCHKDKCGSCIEVVTKLCRCGLHSKEVQCKKLYLCETKCKQMKDCNKHPCNRKCCDGNCPPCEKPCGRTLSCGTHKCASVCHRGPCYPCQLTEKVYCRCATSSITVPCGRRNKTRPPKCNETCKIPPDCHHPRRENHKCHFGDCPPCRQVCEKIHAGCSHSCPAVCHTSVLVKLESKKASMPWEETGPQYEKRSFPCPDCVVPVPVTCLGGHETADWPCHAARPNSCGRPCGRSLTCGNHACSKECHVIVNSSDGLKAGDNCDVCHNQCSKKRPEGCTHPCPNRCHPGDCPPCKQMIRVKCHCGLNQPYVPCKDWVIGEDKENLLSCGNQCPNNYPCGHRCRSNCHSGPCKDGEICKKKIKVTCPCRRIKKEYACEIVRGGSIAIGCDETCAQKKQDEEKLRVIEDERKKKDEELRNRKELERYEKMFHGKKKYKERKTLEEVERGVFAKYRVPILVVIISALASISYTFFL